MAGLVRTLEKGDIFTNMTGGVLYLKIDGHHVCLTNGSLYTDEDSTYADLLGSIVLRDFESILDKKFERMRKS